LACQCAAGQKIAEIGEILSPQGLVETLLDPATLNDLLGDEFSMNQPAWIAGNPSQQGKGEGYNADKDNKEQAKAAQQVSVHFCHDATGMDRSGIRISPLPDKSKEYLTRRK
jgi:hypothetical protein